MRIVDRLVNNAGDLVSFADFANEYYTYHKNGWTNYFTKASNRLTNLAAQKTGDEQALINGLIQNLESIIKATPNQIPNLISMFTSAPYIDVLAGDTLPKKQFRKEIEVAFGYSDFRKSAKASWFAEKFEIKACLYCNAQFTLAIGKDGTKKKLLFQLDHFYDKSTYPFLSLTLGNLVPACSSCNIAKSNTPFSLLTHIHPYYEDANSMFDFFIDQEKALEYLLGKRDYKLLAPKIRVINSKFTSQKNIFSVEEIYQKHSDIVEELILKSLYYNESRRTELRNNFLELNLSESTIDRFVLGNYSLDSEINKRPLAKLSKDISKQLKIFRL